MTFAPYLPSQIDIYPNPLEGYPSPSGFLQPHLTRLALAAVLRGEVLSALLIVIIALYSPVYLYSCSTEPVVPPKDTVHALRYLLLHCEPLRGIFSSLLVVRLAMDLGMGYWCISLQPLILTFWLLWRG